MNRPQLDLTPLRQSLGSLEDGLDVVRDAAWFNQQNDKVRHTLIAGVIQNFEFVYEISTKMLRRRLEMDALNPSEVDFANFRDVLRIAAEKGLIPLRVSLDNGRQCLILTDIAHFGDLAHESIRDRRVFRHL